MTPRIVLALAALLLAAGSAQAQINPFRGQKQAPRLAQSDIAQMGQATQRLLDVEAPAPGSIEAWNNEATGAAGKVTYVGPRTPTVRGQKQTCRRLKYDATPRGAHTARVVQVNWCRQPDGKWKMY
jgi:surface antigen